MRVILCDTVGTLGGSIGSDTGDVATNWRERIPKEPLRHLTLRSSSFVCPGDSLRRGLSRDYDVGAMDVGLRSLSMAVFRAAYRNER